MIFITRYDIYKIKINPMVIREIVYNSNNKEFNNFTYLIIFFIIIISSHFYRDIEYFYNIADKFCFNLPVFIVNNLKLFLVIVCISIMLSIQLNS